MRYFKIDMEQHTIELDEQFLDKNQVAQLEMDIEMAVFAALNASGLKAYFAGGIGLVEVDEEGEVIKTDL